MCHIVANTTPSYAVQHYSTILVCRHGQVSPLTNGQTDQMSVPYGQSQGNDNNKKDKSRYKMWLPCHALLNFPISCAIANLYHRGSPKSTDPPLRIHDGVPTGSSGHTIVGGIMEPQWLPI